MSLEQALADNTAAMNRLATVLVTAAEAGALAASAIAAAPAPAEVKAVRAKKADAAPAVNDADLPNEGDPKGTRYFHIPQHNTVYRQQPGEPDCALAGAALVSGAEYLQHKADIEKKFPTAATPAPEAAAPAPAATPAPATSAPSAPAPAATASDGPTFEQVVAKMRELHAAQQNAGVKKVLDLYKATSVPQLNGKATNAELIAAIDGVLLGL